MKTNEMKNACSSALYEIFFSLYFKLTTIYSHDMQVLFDFKRIGMRKNAFFGSQKTLVIGGPKLSENVMSFRVVLVLAGE